MGLAERGDTSSAILACRQAISLVPNSAQSYSMLGLLLERSGDASGAITAYEKVLELDPSSLLERESLGRLRATAQTRRTMRDNSFDEFEEERTEDLPTASAVEAPVKQSEPDNIDVSNAVLSAHAARTVDEAFATSPTAAEFDFTPVDETIAVATTEAQSAASDAIVEASWGYEAAAAKPASRSNAAATGNAMPFPSTMPKPAPSIFDADGPLTLPQKEVPLTTGQKLLRRPSFYFRSVPLTAAAAASVLFLLWAHSSAPQRVADNMVPAPIPMEDLPPEPQPTAPRVAQNQPAAATVPQDPTANVPVAQSPAATTTTTTTVQVPAATTSNTASAPAAPSPATAQPPQSPGNASQAPAPTAPATAAPPPDAGGSSTGRGPVNTTGTGDRSYVQVGPSGRSPIARPENNAAADEQAAGNDARSGRADSAIERLSRSIDSGGSDVAFRLQQRAQMYLQNGDGARAVADFQAAINAYEAMISRGDRVAIARSGIQACRRGMQIAVSRR